MCKTIQWANFCNAFVLCNGQTLLIILAKVPSELNNTPNTMDKARSFHDIKVWVNKLNDSLKKGPTNDNHKSKSLKQGWKRQVCLRFQQAKDCTTNLSSMFGLKERAIWMSRKKLSKH